jgi:hypothetical protein
MLLNTLLFLLRLNHCVNLRLLSSGMLHHVGLEVGTDVSDKLATFFFYTEDVNSQTFVFVYKTT